MYVYMYVHMYVCMYVCMYMYIYIGNQHLPYVGSVEQTNKIARSNKTDSFQSLDICKYPGNFKYNKSNKSCFFGD